MFFDNWFFKGGIRFDSANELMDLSAGMDKALKNSTLYEGLHDRWA